MGTLADNQRRIMRTNFNNIQKRELMELTEFISPNMVMTTANTVTVVGNVKFNVDELQFANDNFNGGHPVLGGSKYLLRGTLFTSTSATNGIALDFNNSTATTTNVRLNAGFFTANTFESFQTTALATNFASAPLASVIRVDIVAVFNCTSSGNIGLRFCESGSATGATILQHSHLSLMRVS